MDVVFAKLTLETLWLSDRASEHKFDGLQIPFLVGDSNTIFPQTTVDLKIDKRYFYIISTYLFMPSPFSLSSL